MNTFALMGSGEFEPWSAEMDRQVLDRADGDGRVVIMPTASAREGDAVFDDWAEKGLAHYASLGIPAEVVPLKTRDDASRPELIAQLEGASVAFFSGGNPAYLCTTLRDTPFWSELRAAMDRGLAYVGCSAGIACLGDRAPDSAAEDLGESVWKPGLGVFPGAWFGPHWDALDSFVPGLTDFIVSSVPAGDVLFAVDERTAAIGDGAEWSVVGAAAAHVYRDGEWAHHPAGSTFPCELG
ncbi:MAG: Type 1 glutamine amidotransferase-like domain-containing protein [Actinomycetota bacterium]